MQQKCRRNLSKSNPSYKHLSICESVNEIQSNKSIIHKDDLSSFSPSETIKLPGPNLPPFSNIAR